MQIRSDQKEIVLRIAERLAIAPIGEIVRYQTLHAAAGQEVNGWMIRRARDLLIETRGIAFGTVRKEGLRRLGSADGTEYTGEKALLRIRRASRVGARRLRSVARLANDLSPDQQRRANARLCALGLIEHLSMARTVETLPSESTDVRQSDSLSPLRAALGLE